MSHKNHNKKINWVMIVIVMIVYIGLNAIGIIYHEKWLDEAQIWLIARDLNPWQIIQEMHYELSPSLWHQILHLFAANNFPYITQSILNSLAMIAATYVLLRYVKIKNSIKILLIFSYFWAFEYALIGKSYSLTILCLFLIAAWYPYRQKHKWWYAIVVALMANTNTIGMISAGTVIIIEIWDLIENKNKKISNWLPIIFMAFGLAGAVGQVYPVADINHGNGLFRFKHYLTAINGFAMSFAPWKVVMRDNLLLVREGIWSFSWLNTIIFIIFFSAIIVKFAKQPKILCFLLINYFGLAYLLIFRDNGHLRHYGFFIIWLILALGFETSGKKNKTVDNKKTNMIFMVILILSLLFLNICCVKAYYLEIKYAFSPTQKAAEFIRMNNWDKAYWITDSFYMSSLLPYFPEKKIWQANCHQEISFFQVNKKCIEGMAMTDENIKTITKKQAINGNKIIYFTNKEISNIKTRNWKLIYHNTEFVFGYDYPSLFIYEYIQ